MATPKETLPTDEAEHVAESDQFAGATPVAPTDDEIAGTDAPADTSPVEQHNGEAEAQPEPAELSDGSTVQVHQDSQHVGFSEDHNARPGDVTTIDHSVTITDQSGNRSTVETNSADASAFLHFIVTALDKLGFKRG